MSYSFVYRGERTQANLNTDYRCWRDSNDCALWQYVKALVDSSMSIIDIFDGEGNIRRPESIAAAFSQMNGVQTVYLTCAHLTSPFLSCGTATIVDL